MRLAGESDVDVCSPREDWLSDDSSGSGYNAGGGGGNTGESGAGTPSLACARGVLEKALLGSSSSCVAEAASEADPADPLLVTFAFYDLVMAVKACPPM